MVTALNQRFETISTKVIKEVIEKSKATLEPLGYSPFNHLMQLLVGDSCTVGLFDLTFGKYTNTQIQIKVW
jgi:uncharacterized protein (UPF0297 family)